MQKGAQEEYSPCYRTSLARLPNSHLSMWMEKACNVSCPATRTPCEFDVACEAPLMSSWPADLRRSTAPIRGHRPTAYFRFYCTQCSSGVPLNCKRANTQSTTREKRFHLQRRLYVLGCWYRKPEVQISCMHWSVGYDEFSTSYLTCRFLGIEYPSNMSQEHQLVSNSHARCGEPRVPAQLVTRAS